MRIVVLSLFIVLMGCSSVKDNSINSFEKSKLDSDINNKEIVSFFSQARISGVRKNILNEIDQVYLSSNSYTNHRSFKNNIVNLRKSDNFILVKKDSIYLRLYKNDSERIEYAGKFTKEKKQFNSKKKAYFYEYSLLDNKYDLSINYYSNNNVDLKLNGAMSYRGTWKEYENSVN